MPPNQQITTLLDLERHTLIYQDNILKFFGLEMCQVPEAILGINRLLNHYKPKNIVEIGSGKGGLTCLLALYCKLTGAKLFPYERGEINKNQTFWDLSRDFGFPIIVEDPLHDEIPQQNIKSIVASPARCLILCDAEKIKEFNIFSDSMKAGDLIMAHDYAPDKQTYEAHIKHNIWSCNEVVYSDLKAACDRNGIKEVSADDFWPAVWFVGIKV